MKVQRIWVRGSVVKIDCLTGKNPMTVKNRNGDSLLWRAVVDGSFVTVGVELRRRHAVLGVVIVTVGRVIVKCCRGSVQS
jgi:hypothetical protein